MYESDTINLLRTRTSISPKLTAIGKELRLVGVLLMSIVIGVGILTVVAQMILTKNYKEHQGLKKQMEEAIVAETKKEGLFISVQDRLKTIDTILSRTFPWDSALSAVLGLGAAHQIKSASIDDAQQVSVRIETDTFEEARSVIEKIVSYILQRTIVSPILTSLKLNEEGKIQLSLSFQYTAK